MSLLIWLQRITGYLFIFISGILIGAAITIKKYIPINDTLFSSYISVTGEILGGLLGGIVAFYIVKIQIERERQLQKQIKNRTNYNIIYSWINELEHNKEIFILLADKEVNSEYIESLETEVWTKISFEITMILDEEQFSFANELYREIRDLKSKVLSEYKEGKIDYKLRLHSIEKLIIQLEQKLTENKANINYD